MRLRDLSLVGCLVGGCAAPLADAGDPSLERRFASSARPLHVVLVMDITNSWTQTDFAEARTAALAFLDVLVAEAGPDDLVGMVVFTGRYGVEHTPMTPVVDAVALGIPASWEALRTASKAGHVQPNGNCTVFPYNHSRYETAPFPQNEFGLPANTMNDSSWPQNTYDSLAFPPVAPQVSQREADEDGCYPNMWREYADESGTDHAVGLAMARTMFREHPDRGVYRAMVVMTDGSPNGTGAHLQRDAAGYEETRWRYTMGPARSTNDVIAATWRIAANAWDRHEVHTWATSFVTPASWMHQVVHGDGVFVQTNDATDLTGIYEDIARTLPY